MPMWRCVWCVLSATRFTDQIVLNINSRRYITYTLQPFRTYILLPQTILHLSKYI